MKAPHQVQLTSERWQQIKAIVAEALEEKSATARGAFVRQRCDNDAELLNEVKSLLEQTTGSLEEFAQHTTESVRRQISVLAPGQRVGAYRILRELGRGGMGAVYLAERADGAFQKQVAIKVLKRGTDTDEVLRRFCDERQILARLNHANIAGLVDAGTTEDGLPYFLMDYIDGKPITKFADDQSLSIKERLALFRTICSAVSYAHQHLIIHRDLKPSNVLVTVDGEIKLLDFGVAKLLDESTPEVTSTMQRRMTPEYASPEQVRGEPVTTISDVYSLGVLLYELLAGSRPYKLKTRSAEEITKAIREQEPTKPSTAVAKDNPQSAIRNPKVLRGDLDNIVLKALRKDPGRRYGSVDQFSADIRRYLEGLPVRARKDTAAYRAGKFVKRHRVGVGVVALMLSILTAGIVATTIEARRANRRFNDVRQLAHSVLFDYHDAIAALPGSTKIRERLVKDALQYLDELANDQGNEPKLQRELATAYQRVGQIQGNSYYANLGDTAGAMNSYQKSLAIRSALIARQPDDKDLQQELADSHEGIGDMHYTIGDLRRGLESYERALVLREKVANESPTGVEGRLALAQLHMKMGDIKGMESYSNLGDLVGALDSYKKSEAILEPMSAADPENRQLSNQLADLLTRVGMLSDTTGDVASALTTETRAVKIAEHLVEVDPNNRDYQTLLLAARAFLRYALVDNGQLAQAIQNSQEAIGQLQRMLERDPKDTSTRRNLGVAYNALGQDLLAGGDVNASLESYHKALAISQAILVADPENEANKSDVAFTEQHLGEAQFGAHDYKAALENYDKALSQRQPTLTADPSNARAKEDVSKIYADIGNALAAKGDYKQAIDRLAKSIELTEAVSAQAPSNARLRSQLALRYFELGKLHLALAQRSTSGKAAERDEARKWFVKSSEIWQELQGKGTIVPANAGKPEEVAQEVAKCDALAH